MTWKITTIICTFFICAAFVLMPLTWKRELTLTSLKDLEVMKFRHELQTEKMEAIEKAIGVLIKMSELDTQKCKKIFTLGIK